MPIISAFRRLRQEDGMFKVSQHCIVKLSQKQQQKETKKKRSNQSILKLKRLKDKYKQTNPLS